MSFVWIFFLFFQLLSFTLLFILLHRLRQYHLCIYGWEKPFSFIPVAIIFFSFCRNRRELRIFLGQRICLLFVSFNLSFASLKGGFEVVVDMPVRLLLSFRHFILPHRRLLFLLCPIIKLHLPLTHSILQQPHLFSLLQDQKPSTFYFSDSLISSQLVQAWVRVSLDILIVYTVKVHVLGLDQLHWGETVHRIRGWLDTTWR